MISESTHNCEGQGGINREDIACFDQYVGPGYSLPTDSMVEAVKLFARHEAILLDPVYSGKAAAGLIDLVRSGHFAEGANVLNLLLENNIKY